MAWGDCRRRRPARRGGSGNPEGPGGTIEDAGRARGTAEAAGPGLRTPSPRRSGPGPAEESPCGGAPFSRRAHTHHAPHPGRPEQPRCGRPGEAPRRRPVPSPPPAASSSHPGPVRARAAERKARTHLSLSMSAAEACGKPKRGSAGGRRALGPARGGQAPRAPAGAAAGPPRAARSLGGKPGPCDPRPYRCGPGDSTVARGSSRVTGAPRRATALPGAQVRPPGGPRRRLGGSGWHHPRTWHGATRSAPELARKRGNPRRTRENKVAAAPAARLPPPPAPPVNPSRPALLPEEAEPASQDPEQESVPIWKLGAIRDRRTRRPQPPRGGGPRDPGPSAGDPRCPRILRFWAWPAPPGSGINHCAADSPVGLPAGLAQTRERASWRPSPRPLRSRAAPPHRSGVPAGGR